MSTKSDIHYALKFIRFKRKRVFKQYDQNIVFLTMTLMRYGSASNFSILFYMFKQFSIHGLS